MSLSPAAGASSSRARILIVEDNELNLRLAREVLHLYGFQTSAALTGEQGVEMALRDGYDLILMDVQLPGMDGLEATRRIKGAPETREVPVIAVSALARDEDRFRAMESGCDDYVCKPYKIKTLIHAVELALKLTPDVA
jgi:two-component system cell cycle response regulator DivK